MDNIQVILSSSTTDSFWECINVLLLKPHVVNKRLWGHKALLKGNFKPLSETWRPPLKCHRLRNMTEEHLIKQLDSYFKNELQLRVCSEDKFNSSINLLVMELFPKNYLEQHAIQLICVDNASKEISFFDITPETVKQKLCPTFPYVLQLSDKKILLKTNSCDVHFKSYQWLLDTVMPHFIKWSMNNSDVNKQICNQSLSLVSNDKYYLKYNELKQKYGKEMVKIWPECTDPSKFVYEDVAIATYLLLLWENEKSLLKLNRLQTFADLGCGNGLLAFILTMEGHLGIGIDVRKRRIWDVYPCEVKLKEQTITPFADIFTESDWIIGNHSDELTPWIPVIAARSSYKCNFFLLPCCAYNFDGSKYQRQDSSKSLYNEYLIYIKKICEDLRFITGVDRLKIPSTKRICLISKGRTYPENEYYRQNNIIHSIISSDSTIISDDISELSIKNFKAREPLEKVRNCTQLDAALIDTLVNKITDHLLDGCSINTEWCLGKTVEIAELALLIPPGSLKKLKSECGGLQTLLKNKHQIFKVQSGKVQLRYPKTIDEVNKEIKRNNKNKSSNLKLQQKPCWFYKHHPQGCPLTATNCSYSHVKVTFNKTL